MKRWTSWWPWLFVVACAIWVSWPLLNAEDKLYTFFRGDQIKTQWFYDYVARVLTGDADPWILEDFNHPHPVARGRRFPALADGILAAPVTLLFDWPRRWSITQALPILASGLGVASLARALGSRGLGIAVAGALGTLAMPIWREVFLGRMNSAWPSLLIAVIAAATLCTRVGRPGLRGLLYKLPWLLPIALCGAAGGASYPPYVLMLAPLGVACVLLQLRPRAWAGWLVLVAGAALAVSLAWPGLVLLWRNGTYPLPLGPDECPKATRVMELDRWLLRPHWPVAVATGTPLASVVALATWCLAPLALLAPGRRLPVAVGLLSAAVLVVLAAGPCPSWTEGELIGDATLQARARALDAMVDQVHDRTRFGAVGAMIGAVLTGVGVEALARRGAGRLRWLATAAASLLGLAVVGSAALMVLGELSDPGRWNPAPTADTTEFWATAEPGPIAELPFNLTRRFISVIEAPGSPRLNPLDNSDHHSSNDAAAAWLYALGQGRPVGALSSDAWRRTSIRWVSFDESLCGDRKTIRRDCAAGLNQLLHEALGEPVHVTDSLQIWDVLARTP